MAGNPHQSPQPEPQLLADDRPPLSAFRRSIPLLAMVFGGIMFLVTALAIGLARIVGRPLSIADFYALLVPCALFRVGWQLRRENQMRDSHLALPALGGMARIPSTADPDRSATEKQRILPVWRKIGCLILAAAFGEWLAVRTFKPTDPAWLRVYGLSAVPIILAVAIFAIWKEHARGQ